ncbi:MAG TPA: acyl-ACP desaturase [Blastocatellia bacterium]|nr:acyl-ACP desaturase [Blastocatellia bacterium]
MSTEIERYISVSAKIETGDIDWEEAKGVGLSEDERFVLTYFSDIESQTVRYLRTLLQMKLAFRPAVSAFLMTWGYEEFFHGQALANLMAVCGHPLEEDRVERVQKKAKLNEWLEAVFGPLLSKIFSNQFPAVYMSFGAIQEMTTLRGYERLMDVTRNPALKILCDRIARQERRHFAWYFNNAKEQLEQSRLARLLARKLLELNWVPVGAGVKSDDEVTRLFSILFPAEHGKRLVREVDARIGRLPGLEGIRLMQPYFQKRLSYV